MKRVLFVDDEPRILEALERLLFGAEDEWAADFVTGGQAAVEALEQERFDVLVTDMRMPGMDGAELLRHVHARYPDVVRIVLSGHTELEAALRALPIAHQFLCKPCDAKTLRNALERACRLQDLISDEAVRGVVGGIVDLPARPQIYSELTLAFADDKVTTEKIVRIVQRDLAVSSKLLHLVNSAFFSPRRRVTDIAGAVTLLGTDMLRHVVLSIEVFADRKYHGSFSVGEESRHALLVAALASRLVAPTDRNDAFLTGLLHDIGVLVIANSLPDYFAELCTRIESEHGEMHALEQAMRGVTHAEIGAYLLGLWGMPFTIVEAVANHHAPDRSAGAGMSLTAATYLANRLAREATRKGEPRLLEAELARLGIEVNLDEWRSLAAALATEQGHGSH